MEAIGLLVTLQARPGREADAETLLKSAQPLALDEKGTLKWYAINVGPGKFGIFNTFANERGRNAHVTGEIAKALGARAETARNSSQPTLERLGINHGNKNWPKKEWLLNRALIILASRMPVSRQCHPCLVRRNDNGLRRAL